MRTSKLIQAGILLSLSAGMSIAHAKVSPVEVTQKQAENQVRRLLDPVLDKYCQDECKLMSVTATVDIAAPEQIAPGFDEVETGAGSLAPSSARVKILINEKVGPISRQKLLDLAQQYLDTLDFPVKIETDLARFPEPIESASKVAELRERVKKSFTNTVQDLFQQFCPNHCLLADLEISTEAVNTEEAQYNGTGEIIQDGSVAIRIKDINASILVDDKLSPEERTNILEMAKLKTNYLKNVTLSAKSMKFPRSPMETNYALNGGVGHGGNRSLASENSSSNSTSSNSSSQDMKSTTNNMSQTTEKNNSVLNSSNNTTENTNQRNNNTTTNQENASRQERFERFEKIERVESGDAVQAELNKFKVYGLIFGCSILSLLIFVAMASMRTGKPNNSNSITRVIQSLASDPASSSAPSTYSPPAGATAGENEDRASLIGKRYQIERYIEELTNVFAQQPKVAKHVFSRILTEEGVETTAQYIHLFGEGIVVDMIRDPSLQSDVSELMEFYAKNPIELTDDEKLELLRALHNRTISGKLMVLGNRSSNLFDFLSEMDGPQILEMVRTESMTVKAIVLTQIDPQKRGAIYANLDENIRMDLLAELSRIDHLPRDYIFNVANALKRKRKENPRLNTEALPGSEVLVNLLERTAPQMQRTVVKNLEVASPESARNVKSKLVSIDTLRYLRDGQLLEVILSLKHDELLQFLKGAPADVRNAVFAKSPKELIIELEEELTQIGTLSREAYNVVERKVLNRMKIMANDGLINLVETNERMFAASEGTSFVQSVPAGSDDATKQGAADMKKVAGW